MLISDFCDLILLSLHAIMANDYFQFRQFVIHQDQCAMKVGTDGTLLGAWAQAPCGTCRILDIGTGTGLIALMMAQRYPEAKVVGVDIDENATSQAAQNVSDSPFADNITIVCADICVYMAEQPFDVIVSNPPYYEEHRSMISPDLSRRMARQTSQFDFKILAQLTQRLLKPDGSLSLILPVDGYHLMASEALKVGLNVSRLCRLRTTPKKESKRVLLEFRKNYKGKVETFDAIIEMSPGIRSQWYQELIKDFYIK